MAMDDHGEFGAGSICRSPLGLGCNGISQSQWFLIETNVRKAKEGEGLEAHPCTDGIKDFLSSTHTGGNRISDRKGKWVQQLMGLSGLIPKQLPNSTTGAQCYDHDYITG